MVIPFFLPWYITVDFCKGFRMHLSIFQVKFTVLRRVLQVIGNFQRFTCQLGHEPIKCKPLMDMYYFK
jgi:hypothetical protein